MINKKIVLKIFIIFFITISTILSCNISNAATLTVSNTNITVYENNTTTITLKTDLNVTANDIGVKFNVPGHTEGVGQITYNVTGSQRNGMMTEFTIEINGTKEGNVGLQFRVGGQLTEQIQVKVLKSKKIKLNLDITDDEFLDQYQVNNDDGITFSQPFTNIIVKVVNNLLAILQILGAIVLVLSLALAGFNGILGSNENFADDLGLSLGDKADGVQQLTKENLSIIIRRVIIGSFILFMSASIVKIVFKLITGI